MENLVRNRILSATVFGCLAFLNVAPASAGPINISTVLTGDPRPDRPDNLEVLVSITGDESSNKTYWNINIDTLPLLPWVSLDEFGFNLAGSSSQYTFSNFNLPYTPTTGILNGSGQTSFMLNLEDPSGMFLDANNIVSLSFTLTKSLSNFTLADFMTAPESCSTSALLGCNQLAASLNVGLFAQQTGVVIGNYSPVPEPASLLLLGSGAAAAALTRRRRRRKNNGVAAVQAS
jgi:hypothetical protein